MIFTFKGNFLSFDSVTSIFFNLTLLLFLPLQVSSFVAFGCRCCHSWSHSTWLAACQKPLHLCISQLILWNHPANIKRSPPSSNPFHRSALYVSTNAFGMRSWGPSGVPQSQHAQKLISTPLNFPLSVSPYCKWTQLALSSHIRNHCSSTGETNTSLLTLALFTFSFVLCSETFPRSMMMRWILSLPQTIYCASNFLLH